MRRFILFLLAGLAGAGCKNNIGDSCANSTDCSVTGERQCDLSQPGGYCTVFACDPDTCPQGACVEWRYIPSRTAETWCMKTCNDDGNCRVQYSCVFPEEISASGGFVEGGVPESDRVARIIDFEGRSAQSKICVALAPESQTPTASEPDAGL
ncbi:MAG: hypothetical protein OEV36_01120 [Myxococcales bacterium]|nr:hypothetical protein [Myxococcales bacterium]